MLQAFYGPEDGHDESFWERLLRGRRALVERLALLAGGRVMEFEGRAARNLLSWIRRRLGITGYWSLAGYAKRKVKTAVSFIFDFEESVVRYVKERDVDGVICGHIHAAAIKEIGGIAYINCGDWVDSCTAILEHEDGHMELIEWAVPPQQVEPERIRDVGPKPNASLREPIRTPAAAREAE